MFSALDNALSQKAEDTLDQFAAVKKAEVNFQTSLGHRKGQLGINLIGAFAERQNNAFGWQVRVYGAQQDGKGFNAGVFYRHITDNVLIGANAFVDYENHKLGNFYRYSIGGEAQNRYGSFAANYYVPITKEKRKDGGVIFSRKGYDAKLRLNIPNAKFLKAAVDYYNFGDEHGAESDDGFRYGAEAHLIPGLRIALLYDNGEEELGGEVSYIHTIGEVQQSQTTNEQWTPDLFAAVSREHSQRIVSVSVNVSVAPSSPSLQSAVNQVEVGASEIIGVVNIPASFAATAIAAISPPTGFAINGNTLIWAPAMRGLQTLSIAVSDTPLSQTATLLITATGFQILANVQATLLIDAGLLNAAWVSSYTRFQITLPPGGITSHPFAVTAMRIDGARNHTGAMITLIREISPGTFDPLSTVSFQNFDERRMAIYTLSVVAGSEEMQTTLFAQAGMPFDMPGFSPPSFPQMPKLAFADPVILARWAGIQHNRVVIIRNPRRQYAQ